MIVNNFEVKQMLLCASKLQIIKVSSKEMVGESNKSLTNLLGRSVIMIMMIMKIMDNNA